MKDPEGVFIFIVGVVVACLLFWGVVTTVKKSFSLPKPEKVDSSQTVDERRPQDTIERQKRLMEDQRQKLRDYQRRY